MLWTECVVGGYFALQPHPSEARTTQATQLVAASAAAPRRNIGKEGWVYADAIGHGATDIVRFAKLASNTLAAVYGDAAPAEATTGNLEITSSPRTGNSVLVSFARHLSHCRTGACQVRASFDQTDPESFPAQDASTAHATRLRLGDANRFAQRLSVAHELTLFASLGNRRQVILNFSVDGYQLALRSVRVMYAALPAYRG